MRRTSISTTSGQANAQSSSCSISRDGRYLTFSSLANNLVSGDTNNLSDIFVHDLHAHETTRVSLYSDGSQSDGPTFDPSINADGRYVAFRTNSDVLLHDRQTGTTEPISIWGYSAGWGNANSYSPSISANGMYVAFTSEAYNLGGPDLNDCADIIVRDRADHMVNNVSCAGNGPSTNPSISGDGAFVAFESDANNLVANDNNDHRDIILVRLVYPYGAIRVSTSSLSIEGNGDSQNASVSSDGRFVAFESASTNLVSSDTNGFTDIFVKDTVTGKTVRVSIASGGSQGNGSSVNPSISGNGRFIAFRSSASNLVPSDTNGQDDIFVHDQQTGSTSRVSITSAGTQANAWTFDPVISSDGRFVAMTSFATNLVPGDSNNTSDVFAHQYGPGDGWGNWTPPATLPTGSTIGDPEIRVLQRVSVDRRPIILVNGIDAHFSVSGLWEGFFGGTDGVKHWNNSTNPYYPNSIDANGFIAHFVEQFGSEGFKMYDPNAPDNDPIRSKNGLLFVCNTLDTRESLWMNAFRLNQYIDSIAGLPQFEASAKFDLVGYSMGGLIARMWEQRYDNSLKQAGVFYRGGTKRLRNLVTFNTPHLGTRLADLLLGPASVVDMYPASMKKFNKRFKGFPGVRYSRFASTTGMFVWGLGFNNDLVVSERSQRDGGWIGQGTEVSPLTFLDYAHVGVLGFDDIRNSSLLATYVHEALYAGLLSSDEPAAGAATQESLGLTARLFQGSTVTRAVPVPSGTTTLVLGSNWAEGSASFNVVEPGGRIIDPTTAAADPNIEYVENGGNAFYTVSSAVKGNWTLRLTGGNGVPGAGTECRLGAADDAPVAAEAEAPEVVRKGQSGRFTVRLSDSQGNLKGGIVDATITLPSASTTPIAFYDDGSHGDGVASDGLYGSNPVVGSMPFTYTVNGRISGTRPTGTVSRLFTASFDASPETGRIVSNAYIQTVDDPADPDAFFDLLNVGVNIYYSDAGSYVLSADLVAPSGQVIDQISQVLERTTGGAAVEVLRFRGQVIGEAHVDGPYTIRNVRITDETEDSILSDCVANLGSTNAYSKLEFETITPRTVTPSGLLAGTTLISLPLEPTESMQNLRAILGGNAQFVGAEQPWAHNGMRGRAFRVAWRGPRPPIASFLGTTDDTEFSVVYEDAGPQTIGCPYNVPCPLQRCFVRNNATGAIRPALTDASTPSPWVNWSFAYQSGGAWKQAKLSGGDDNALRPWFGYRFSTNLPNVTITFRD